MNRCIGGKRVAAAVLLLAAVGARADGLDNLVSLKGVPESVMKTAGDAAPKVEWLVAARIGDGKHGVWYRLTGKGADGRTVSVTAHAGGTLADVRIDLPPTEAPAAVVDALKAEAPDFRPRKIEAVGRTTAKAMFYRFEGDNGDGWAAMLVSADGRTVKKEGGN